MIKGKESFENLLQATLDAEVKGTASAVPKNPLRIKTKHWVNQFIKNHL